MLYKLSRSVPANTTTAAPDWQKLKVSKGTIIEWVIFFPERAKNLCKFRVEYHGVQILPYNRSTWIYGIFKPITPKESINIDGAPYELDVFGINSDDTFEHEYNLYVNIMPDKPVTPGVVPSSVINRFKSLFGGGGP